MAALSLGPFEPELQPGVPRIPLGAPDELRSVHVYSVLYVTCHAKRF